ncbi:glycosyltransferase family 4 protein [Candidatus Falkowbacteria bacterium]|nr:glycosyltransferase family 4 protein [Candidatus Falkowbacteria bacterium]
MAEKTKILYLVTQPEWGGAQRYIFDLASNLDQTKYEAAIATGLSNSSNQELLTKVDDGNIKSYRLNNLVREINPVKDLKAYFEVGKLLKELKPDILHLNSSKAGVIGALAGRQARIKKIIYTVHGFVFNEPMSAGKKAFYKFAERFSARYKDTLICVSEFDRQVGLKNKIAAEKKLVTIHNGVQKLEFLEKQAARSELGLPADKIIVGTIANFYPTKGLNYLIEAAKIITKKKPEVIFRIIGFGDMENKLKDQIKKLNLGSRFFLGEKLNGYRYLKAFDMYALPSVKEGFPYAILEAMAAGLPIVTTNVGGIAEMINDKNGILVEPKSAEALAEAIIKLMENKNLAEELSRQARQDAAEKFYLEKMLRETEKVYSL